MFGERAEQSPPSLSNESKHYFIKFIKIVILFNVDYERTGRIHWNNACKRGSCIKLDNDCKDR